MTDAEQFEAVLRELAELLLSLGPLGREAVLIGGQVLALEAKRRGGTGMIETRTETGITVQRGFSLEPDLLVDLDSDRFVADQLPDLLRQRGFERMRDFRWGKLLPSGGGAQMLLDLFVSDDADPDDLPTGMTRLAGATGVMRDSIPVSLLVGDTELHINIPDPVSLLELKLRAKLEQRPAESKDSFDIYVYMKLQGLASIQAALSASRGTWE